jgi:UDP-N-acetylmuramoylalanine--D-glutamate ligase
VWYQAKSVIEEQFPDIAFPPHTRIYGKEGYYTRDGKNFTIQNTPIADDNGMLLLGEHNRENACAVLWVCDLLNIEIDHFQAVLQQFSWLEHRLEYVGNYKDILRYNDAIATTPETTCAALDSFWTTVDTLFYWGITWEYKHHLVAKKIQNYGIKQLILFPDTGEELYTLLDEQTKKQLIIFHSRSMEEAVQRAAQHTAPWSIALLSCGSPSFSLRSGFIEKWTRFKNAVRGL